MYKIIITDYDGNSIEVIVSAEIFDIFEDSRKQGLREQNEMRRHRDYRGLQNHYVLQEIASYSDELENEVSRKILLNKIFKVVKTCTPIQQKRFHMYFVEGYTMKEIGGFQGCTKMAVSQSLNIVIRKIREELSLQGLQNAEL